MKCFQRMAILNPFMYVPKMTNEPFKSYRILKMAQFIKVYLIKTVGSKKSKTCIKERFNVYFIENNYINQMIYSGSFSP